MDAGRDAVRADGGCTETARRRVSRDVRDSGPAPALPVAVRRRRAAQGRGAHHRRPVRVNGKVVTELGTKVDPDGDRVRSTARPVHPQELFYCLLNKPKGCITAVTDDRGRPTVMDYLPNLPVAVKPVGRLDFYSEGVLLLTNDGELSARAAGAAAPRREDLPREDPRPARATRTSRRCARGPARRRHADPCRPRSTGCRPRASTTGWSITLTEGKSARSTAWPRRSATRCSSCSGSRSPA